MYLMKPYDDALREILKYGIKKSDRTGVGSISIAGLQRKYSLEHTVDGTHYLPVITGRRVFPRSVFAELLWFISGSTKNQDLEALGCRFWGKWCDENNPKYRALCEKWGYEPGDFGPTYGWQLRHFGADYIQYRALQTSEAAMRKDKPYAYSSHLANYSRTMSETLDKGFDQLAWMMSVLQQEPFGSNGRRCLFSLWNPHDLPKMALPPCHYTFQAIADGDGGLTGILTQRSCDFPVGVPANIQFYSTLTIMMAQQVGMKPRELVHNTNDSHIYLNQVEQVEEYLARPKPASPRLRLEKAEDIFSYTMDSFELLDYHPGERINVPVAA